MRSSGDAESDWTVVCKGLACFSGEIGVAVERAEGGRDGEGREETRGTDEPADRGWRGREKEGAFGTEEA